MFSKFNHIVACIQTSLFLGNWVLLCSPGWPQALGPNQFSCLSILSETTIMSYLAWLEFHLFVRLTLCCKCIGHLVVLLFWDSVLLYCSNSELKWFSHLSLLSSGDNKPAPLCKVTHYVYSSFCQRLFGLFPTLGACE